MPVDPLVDGIVARTIMVDERHAPDQIVRAAPEIYNKKIRKAFRTLNDPLH